MTAIRIDPKIQTWQETLRSCFLSSFVDFSSAVSKEKSKMSQTIRGQDSHLVFFNRPENTNLVEDVKILIPVKHHKILLSGFIEERKNVSADQRPGQSSFFRPEK